MSLINDHFDVFSKARGLNSGLNRHLHSYFVYASREGSGESVSMHICTDSPEPLLLADVISTEIPCTCTDSPGSSPLTNVISSEILAHMALL